MKRSTLTLINAICTALMLLIVACAGGFAIGVIMSENMHLVAIPMMIVFGGLLLFLFYVLSEDIQYYQEERRKANDLQ